MNEQQNDREQVPPTVLQPSIQKSEGENVAPRQMVDDVARRITKAAGVEHLEGFNLQEMFSEVFKKHTDDEVEAYFTVGTAKTIPPIEDVDTSWPKPWVFFRTFLGALIVYIGFVQAWQTFQNLNLVPGLIVIGSFVVPFSTLIFFFETNVRRNVSLYQVLRLLFFGGVLSLIFSLLLFQVSFSLNLNWLGASVAGLVEEPGKLLALLIVVNNPKYKYTLNGLLFGAAIGTGFAAFESAGYALTAALTSSSDNANAMLDMIMMRGMLAPFGHIVWTGMCAAMLWKIKGEQKFNLEMVKDRRFLRIFGIAVVLHMTWNSPIDFPLYGKFVALGFVAWIVILALIQDGLKQLRVEKLAAIENVNPSQST
jgi:protease PrsW